MGARPGWPHLFLPFVTPRHLGERNTTQEDEHLGGTWYDCLRYPHGKVATDTEHTAREDVGRPTDQRHTGQRSSEKLHPTARHVHFYQCCGHHKHNQDHQEREHYPHLRGKPERNTEASVKDVWVGTVDGIVSEESSTFASFLRGHKLRNLNSVDILTYKTSLCYKKNIL